MDKDYDHHHLSLIRPKWADKTIEVVGYLAGNPLDPGKTRSQFHIAFFSSEVVLVEKCFMMVGYDLQTYQEASLDPIRKTTMQ